MIDLEEDIKRTGSIHVNINEEPYEVFVSYEAYNNQDTGNNRKTLDIRIPNFVLPSGYRGPHAIFKIEDGEIINPFFSRNRENIYGMNPEVEEFFKENLDNKISNELPDYMQVMIHFE